MLEQRKDGRPIEKVVLVTAVPAALKALTGLDAATLPERSLHKVRLKACDFAAPMNDQRYADLIYVPVVDGSFSISSRESAAALKAALAGYDLVVDLCEFTALYRRGQTPIEQVQEFCNAHSDVPSDVAKGILNYQNFLTVIYVLQTVFVKLQGRVVRPRNIIRLVYEWTTKYNDEKNQAEPKLADFSVIQDYFLADDKFWSKQPGRTENILVDAAGTPADKEEVRAALNLLAADSKLATLATRVMVTDYFSNLSHMIKDIVTSADPQFTHDLNAILKNRCDGRYLEGVNLKDNAAVSALFERCEELEVKIKAELGNEAVTQHLVDQYQLSGQPGSAPETLDAIPRRVIEEFRKRFTYLAAFIDMWDEAERTLDTAKMNEKINGWYMSNSSLSFVVDALRLGLSVDVTSWAVIAMATNSVGFLPDEHEYLASIKTAVDSELNALFTQLIPA